LNVLPIKYDLNIH